MNRMIDEELEGVEFISMNTDAPGPEAARKAQVTLQIGKKLTRGLGAGARPEVGRQALAESEEEVRQGARRSADLVFVTAGMGGGHRYGRRAASSPRSPARWAALTIGIVTKPFSFEGKKRDASGRPGPGRAASLRGHHDPRAERPSPGVVVPKGTSFRDALKKADEVLLQRHAGHQRPDPCDG